MLRIPPFKKSLTIHARTGARVIGAGGSNAWLAYVVALKHDSVARTIRAPSLTVNVAPFTSGE